MEFKVRTDIKVRSVSAISLQMREYDYRDLAKTVGYFEDLINSYPVEEKNIGVVFGLLGFLQVAFMLALFKTGRNYTLYYYNSDDFPEHTKEYSNHTFLLGPWFGGMANFIGRGQQDQEFNDKHTNIFSADIEQQALSHHRAADLTIAFSKTQQVFVSLQDPTGHYAVPHLASNTGYIEASSIKAAMDNYYHEDDNVVLFRACRHAGVATLSVYPAFFKCAKITLCKFDEEYKQEYHNATHIHAGYELIRDKWPLPKKLRMLTTGGYPFNSDCIDYVTGICDIENIIDCYGTLNFPPPMAIRQLNKGERGLVPFKWVNEYTVPEFNKDGDGEKLYWKSSIPNGFFSEFNHMRQFVVHHYPDYDIIRHYDNVESIDDRTFYFYGPAVSFIRIHHSRWAEADFKTYFSEKTGITDFKIVFVKKDGMNFPVLSVDIEDREIVLEFAKETDLEIDFNFV